MHRLRKVTWRYTLTCRPRWTLGVVKTEEVYAGVRRAPEALIEVLKLAMVNGIPWGSKTRSSSNFVDILKFLRMTARRNTTLSHRCRYVGTRSQVVRISQKALKLCRPSCSGWRVVNLCEDTLRLSPFSRPRRRNLKILGSATKLRRPDQSRRKTKICGGLMNFSACRSLQLWIVKTRRSRSIVAIRRVSLVPRRSGRFGWW